MLPASFVTALIHVMTQCASKQTIHIDRLMSRQAISAGTHKDSLQQIWAAEDAIAMSRCASSLGHRCKQNKSAALKAEIENLP